MAVLAECPFRNRRQSIRSKKCTSKNGKACVADLEKMKRSGKIKYWIVFRLPGRRQRFEKITGEKATSFEYGKDAEARRKGKGRMDGSGIGLGENKYMHLPEKIHDSPHFIFPASQ